MKRILGLFLALSVALGLLAGCGRQAPAAEPTAPGETAAGPIAPEAPAAEPIAPEEGAAGPGELDEAAWLELSHRIYEANQLDALLRRHSSLEYSFTYPETPEKDNYYWETAECYYQEWPGYDYARYDGGRVFYVLQPDGSASPALSCGIDLTGGYDPFFDLFGLPEEEFLDPEHERLTGSFTEDGLLHILTELDEAGSQRWIENILQRASAGETVRMEEVVDPETCEVLRNTVTLEQNGETWAAYGYTAEFDTPEPFSCRMLRACFERRNGELMTVNALADPGTERAQSVSLTVPQGSAFDLEADESSIVFDDEEGTSLTSVLAWDGKSDLDFCVRTDPDQPLIDRYLAFVTEATAERGPAADLEGLTIEALAAANAPEAVLARHQTLFCTVSDRFGGDWYFCAEPGRYFESDYSGEDNLLDDDGNWFLTDSGDGERSLSRVWFVMSDEEREAVEVRPEDLSSVIDLDSTLTEKLVDVKDNGDGTLTLTTRKNTEDTRAGLEAKGVEIPEEYRDAELEVVYLAAADTLEILSFTEYLIVGETRSLTNVTAACYDTELPEAVAGFRAAKEAYLADGASDTKTITVVYDALTPAEESYSLTVPRDVRVQMVFREGCERQYADPEGTVPFDGTPDADGNFMIYCFSE